MFSTFGLYINDDLHRVFKRFVWKLDENYCLRLGGLQLILDRDQKLKTNPVYYPLWSWVVKPGSRELTFYWGEKSIMFVLNHNGLYIYKSAKVEVEDKND
jgi:hypothetical protein